LEGIPLLARPAGETRALPAVDTSTLTAKELRLWEYLLAHSGQVCAKDDLIRAVWPEDKAFFEGIRDDSLAQLVRRLRQKTDPGAIVTVAGRGYRLK
jgi:DNA-binding response OmpR family regulator